MLKKIIKNILFKGINYINKSEAKIKYDAKNERCLEYAYLFNELSRIWPKTILDVGTGMSSLPHLLKLCGFNVTAIDNIKDYWGDNLYNRHYYVENDDITNSKLKIKFDVISCISVLEHIENFDLAMKNMSSLLNEGGRLIISFPYNNKFYNKNIYNHPDSSSSESFSFKTQVFSRVEILRWMNSYNLAIENQIYWDFYDHEYWCCGNMLESPKISDIENRHQLSFLTLKKY